MQQSTFKKIGRGLALVSLLAMFSWTFPFGGDSLEIFLNKKLVFRQLMYKNESLKTVTLSPEAAKQQMEINYRHCGAVGKSRVLLLKNLQNKIVRSWHFTDVESRDASMVVNVQDIIQRMKHSGDRIHLYYTSKELPGGKLLADIIYQPQTVAVR
jgi:hypothetical protein